MIISDLHSREYRLHCRCVPMTELSALDIYGNFTGDSCGFMLESYDEGYDRFTIIAKDPMFRITSEGMSLVIRESASGKEERITGNPLDILKDISEGMSVKKPEDFEGFSGGFVGNLGYDFIRYIESLPDDNPDPIDIETVQLFIVMQYILIDQKKRLIYAVVIDDDKPSHGEAALAMCDEMLECALSSASSMQREKLFDAAGDAAGSRVAGSVPLSDADGHVVSHTDDLKSYSEKVDRIKYYIKEGHIFQTVLSQRWVMETEKRGFDIYKELRSLNPSPYLYYFNYQDFEVIGSSPELIVKQQGDIVSTCPIAGTRPRGRDKAEDERLHVELLNDEKELSEHVMLVDLARNDMGRIAKFGSVRVSELMKIKEYSHVMHIVSLVEGERNEKYNPFDLVASFLPAGTLSGAPKIRAMEIIDELESVRRGLYGGATGYVDFSGDMDFCITIRTLIKKGKLAYVQAGAGIVADSVPEKEYLECTNKAMAIAKVILKDTNEMILKGEV